MYVSGKTHQHQKIIKLRISGMRVENYKILRFTFQQKQKNYVISAHLTKFWWAVLPSISVVGR